MAFRARLRRGSFGFCFGCERTAADATPICVPAELSSTSSGPSTESGGAPNTGKVNCQNRAMQEATGKDAAQSGIDR